jgi:hypothetical protein
MMTMTDKLFGLAAAFAVATGLFWSTMLAAPPVTLAATSQGLDIRGLATHTPKDLPAFDDTYQRHMGILDVLKR